MALGAPIVARDTVYNREVLANAGVFVAPTASAIESGLRRVLTDSTLQRRLADAAKQRAEDAYTWSYVNGLYDDALRGLLPTSLAGALERPTHSSTRVS